MSLLKENMFDNLLDYDFGEVQYVVDEKTHLKSIIAIHSTALGPALGGCRYYTYANDKAALHDVLRLARGMSMKAAITSLPLGGGKAVIIKEAAHEAENFNRKALFSAFAKRVDYLGGRYVTAMDSGTTLEDMDIIHQHTKYVSGLHLSDFRSDDPFPFTARGVFHAMQVVAKERFGKKSLKGLVVAIQGVGHVGFPLLQYLLEEGAKVKIADVNPVQIAHCQETFKNLSVVPVSEIHSVDCDIFAPCALGGILNPLVISELKAKAVVGGANNQLSDASCAKLLAERDILYAPDYVVNAGGLVQACAQYYHDDESTILPKVANIGNTLQRIFDESKKTGAFPSVVADRIATARIAEADLRA